MPAATISVAVISKPLQPSVLRHGPRLDTTGKTVRRAATVAQGPTFVAVCI